MTLTETLTALVKAGKLKSMWRPGMLAAFTRRQRDGCEAVRVVDVPDATTIVVADPVLGCCYRWRLQDDGWRVAELVTEVGTSGWRSEPVSQYITPREWVLDEQDEGTKGCLLGVVRELWPGAYVRETGPELWGCYAFRSPDHIGNLWQDVGVGATEVETMCSALQRALT